MMTVAVVSGGVLNGFRQIEDWDAYPKHKKDARDERGDGGPVLRPVIYEGAGPVENTIVEQAVVRVVRSPAPQTLAHVDHERDRRMGTFKFGGKDYDLAGQSLANVQGAGTLALAALINGAQPGDLRWADPDTDFSWIANDNTQTPMDAQTCWAFAQTAAAHRKDMIFKARLLKDMTPIPADYTADSYWV